ncbi:MAG: hypothetical protein AAFX00_12225, partial [Pseudomonadota bacterium]
MNSQLRETARFDVNDGGPYVDLLRQLRLWRADQDTRLLRAGILVGLAWFVPLVISAVEGNAIGAASDEPFLLSLNAWARFFVAVGLFVLSEKFVAGMLQIILTRFFDAPIVAETSNEKAADLVRQALERRNSHTAEWIILALAVLTTAGTSQMVATTADGASWIVQPDSEGAMRMTLAGIWGVFVSGSIFFFLVYRWAWRFFIWSRLLASFSTLELRLSVLHPDGSGGLKFVGLTPIAFAPLVLAISLWIAPVVAQFLLQAEAATRALTVIMFG